MPDIAQQPTVNSDLLERFHESGRAVSRIYEPKETCAVLGAGATPGRTCTWTVWRRTAFRFAGEEGEAARLS